jgi:transcriptional regulator with XRE-family HTH domain
MNDTEIIEMQRQALRNFMQRNNLSASSWAKKAGVTEATIRHYLSGLNKSLTMLTLYKLAQAAQVTPQELMSFSSIKERKFHLHNPLFIQTFIDLNEFVKSSNLDVDSTTHAYMLIAWYELAQLMASKKAAESTERTAYELLAEKA